MAQAPRIEPVERRDSTSSEVFSSADLLLATSRRGFLKVMVAGTTLVLGGAFLTREQAKAQGLPETLDLGDYLTLAEASYANNLVLEVTTHNRVRFELPRLDKGQGIATALAMLVADELDADYDRTDVTMSDARADRPYTITGSSNTIRAMWEPVRTLASEARARLVTAAAQRWGVAEATLITKKSMVGEGSNGVFSTNGRRASYGELWTEALAVTIVPGTVTPKDPSTYTIVGTPRGRRNAREIVTGAMKYTLDHGVAEGVPANAVCAVIARAPDIQGTVASWTNTVGGMPGVIDVVEVPRIESDSGLLVEGGIAIAARTFHEAFAASQVLYDHDNPQNASIQWSPGPLATTSDANIQATLESINVPLLPPAPLAESLDATFDYPYIAHATMETMTAIAHFDAANQTCEVWYASQTPVYASQKVAEITGIPEASVTLHVPFAGGSFGRHLFAEASFEAAKISQLIGRPVKLLWTRNDDMRHGRFRPKAHHDLRATWLPGNPPTFLTFQHNVADAELDARHGLGDALTAAGFETAPPGQSAFNSTIALPYSFGVGQHVLTEQYFDVPTCSWRSIYSGYVITSNEIFVDELAREVGMDEVAFRLQYLTSDPAKMCLNKVVEMGALAGATWPQPNLGVAIHVEYHSAVAYLVEIDASAPANPRPTRAFCAVYTKIPINPKGLEAQMQGVLSDAWSAMFRAGNQLENGRIREGSYSDFHWARMNHVAPTVSVHVFPAGAGATEPGGAGELGFPPAAAACVNAYSRATDLDPRQFPILEIV